MAVSFVEIAGNLFAPISGNPQTVSITTPAANETLMAFAALELTGTPMSTVQDQNGDNFTLVQQDKSGTAGGDFWYKIADGDETSVVFTNPGNFTGEIVVLTYAGIDTTSPLEDSAEVTTNVSSATTSGSVSATATNASGVFVAMLACERSAQWDSADVSLTNGTLRNDLTRSTGMAGVVVSDQIYASSGVKSETFTGSNDEIYLVGATFKAAGGGGFQAAWARGSNQIIGAYQ